ncbi:SIR2 family protein [Crocinitomix catalasitica]|uniref:SIR2 family protein n=1 Tax=Crocinitomix catalasitica TaxID=184607 RepID=UPI000489C9B1|nr:SIR2 family protein [Crocinitomix catalasitica]
MTNENIQQLKLLKEKLNNQKMSVLIGAGFSKNVSDIFPSWWQLLFDMTYFLFQIEIEEAYSNAINKKFKIDGSKDEFIKSKINYYISKVGYLDIVSQYIKRKGYREAITCYIEEKTPKITSKEKNYYLENQIGKNQNKIKIKEEMLSQHKLLLELPWNNIYTTNYDELLEFSNDSATADNITTEIDTINKEINHLLNEQSCLIDELSTLDTKKNETTNQNSRPIQNGQWDLKGIERRIIDKERELLQLRKAQNECISLVTSSEQLSIKRNKNIIKLHGSLRKKGVRYGFDGDIQKQYVIAREDYESYPSKHEAFTQLMRISLLQESYCLIGFSGDDTNFLEWIKWVREILERGENRSDYKIYLISIDPTPINANKKLFFENHKVHPIFIMRDEVVDFLENQTGLTLKNRTNKPVIELFFKYLKGRNQINTSKATLEILQLNKYKRSWDYINSFQPKKVDFDKIDESSKKISELKKINRLPSLNFAYSWRKQNLLFNSMALIEEVPNKHRNALLQLVILAIKDSYLTPIDFVWNNAELKKVKASVHESSKNIQHEFSMLMLRDSVLRYDVKSFEDIESKLSKKTDNIIYESILISAFGLDFKAVEAKTKSWTPKSDWVTRKTGLLALFDSKVAHIFISAQLGSPSNSCNEELYMLEMHRYVRQSAEFGFDEDLNEVISRYKHLGLKSISENVDYLIEESNKKINDFKRYGEDRFSISNDFTVSNDFTRVQKGLQFIQQMIESGFPIALQRITWRNSKVCYPLFKEIFEYFPYPTIFYSLQFSDEKFLRRLGQDYAYSERLQSCLGEILRTLLKSYLNENTPIHFKRSILYFSSELIIATKPKIWQQEFHEIWKLEPFRKNCLEVRWNAERVFTSASVQYIQDPRIIAEFIRLILAGPESDYSIELLYHLAKNTHLKKFGNTNQSEELTRSIDSIIGMIHESENAIFLIGNIYSILTDFQKSLIFKKLTNIKFDYIENERVWKVLTYFSDSDKKIINQLKSAIIKNKKLFDAGFTDQGLSMSENFIEISTLTNLNNSRYIEWTKTEAILILKKVISEFKKIEDWLKKRDQHNFSSILYEMLSFFYREKSKLEHKKEYHEVFTKAKELYYKQRGYNSLLDGLVSTDSKVVLWTLSELSILIYEEKTIEGYEQEILTFLNKVLLQSKPCLEESLNYLATWINSESLSDNFKIHSHIILKILAKYTQFELDEFEKPFIYKQLIDIANVLNSWNVKDSIIKHWQKNERKTRFNNIKFGINK